LRKKTVPEKQSKPIRRPSIQFYLILMNVILLCLLFPAVGLLFFHQEAVFRDAQLDRTIHQMRQALKNRSASQARNMALSAGYAVAGYDFTFLNNMVQQVVAEDAEIEYCIIMDANGKVIAHNDPKKVGSMLVGVNHQKAATMMAEVFPTRLADGDYLQVQFIEESKSPHDKQVPAMEVLAPIYNGAKLFAALRCGYSLEGLSSQIKVVKQDWAHRSRQFKIYLISITGVFFTIGVVIATLFTNAFVQSMQVLSNGVSQVAQGDLEHQIQPDGLVCAELLHLSAAFNAMTGELKRSRRKLDQYSKSLEHEVAARTQELKDAQDHLLRQAHEAGMAEMAVGILHNIGNAITPAKVGLSRLCHRMDKKPLLSNLPAALDEIGGMIPALPSLSHERKNRLCNMIKLVPAAIEEEYALNTGDLEHIRQKCAHIEGIISLQMRYAHLFDDLESVNIPQVVEDALTLLDDALKKRSIRIVKSFSKVPPIRIEKARLIQIIVNLIKNGYEAMDQVADRDRVIELTINRDKGPPDNLVLSVKDNGIGFSPEEKQNLFKFGYSTKSKGTGFGLHSCANYLIARNGSISAHSAGRDKGAEFVVRLAVYRAKSIH
jgi:C4-dicarboxylate-specific signal transduction histidine kinase